MKRSSLIILSHLVSLGFITSFAYCADPQIPTSASPEAKNTPAAVVAVKSASLVGIKEISFVNIMLNLLDSDVEYRLNESSSIVLACSPFASAESDNHSYQIASEISVGLKFSF